MIYELNFSKKSLKDLSKIDDPNYSKIKIAISNLTENPRPHGYIKLTERDGYRLRVGNYRIIYNIFDQELIIEIISLGHRKEIYD
jgi:mRNA interferase RelE/StbE